MIKESGVNEEISMLDALQRLWHHKAKRKSIRFEITFDDVSRKVLQQRNLYVQDILFFRPRFQQCDDQERNSVLIQIALYK